MDTHVTALNKLRPRFTIGALLILTAVAAIAIAVVTYPIRLRAKTIATYNAQKQAVNETIAEFTSKLEHEGNVVENDSTGSDNNGDWRQHAAVTSTGIDGEQQVCYVEIAGFVTHDTPHRPTWMGILPMCISHRGRALNDRFMAILEEKLEAHCWEYTIDSNCRGGVRFSTFKLNPYLAQEQPLTGQGGHL